MVLPGSKFKGDISKGCNEEDINKGCNENEMYKILYNSGYLSSIGISEKKTVIAVIKKEIREYESHGPVTGPNLLDNIESALSNSPYISQKGKSMMLGGETMKCSCGYINQEGAKFCLNCGRLIGKPKLVLPNREIEIMQDEAIFGREDFEGDLSNEELRYISRRMKPQFKILREGNKFYVQDDSSAGGTKLNGEEIKEKGKQRLKAGNKILLADTLSIKFKIEGVEK
jgi:hypothetical protein